MSSSIAKSSAMRIAAGRHRLFSNTAVTGGRAQLPAALEERVSQTLDNMKSAGTFKTERVITTPQNSSIKVQTSTKPVLNFCANNYLGLADHPTVVQRASEYLNKWGNGLSSVRFICGTQTIHKDLENQITEFYGQQETRDTILYASCFDANAGIFESLLTDQDAIISDSLNHASIIDGVRLCKAKRFRYANGDVADLDRQLQLAADAGCRVKMVATDGVFSMDGVIAPLKEICDVVEKHGAVLFVDDAHATGFLGPSGRGSGEYWGVMDRVHLVNSTLGKALGGASGGYTVGDKLLVTLLRNTSRPYLFSNTLAPSMVGAAAAAIDLVNNPVTRGPLLDQLWSNAALFRSRMSDSGFVLAGEGHAIIPVMLGDARLASLMAEKMLARGIYVVGFSFPVVPKDKARIRVQLSAAHSTDQVNYAVDSFIEVGRELNVIQ
ncbi:2-amino-3-ketobutyrate coenzyme A ligase [Kickxella alabastrina]|uniref:2-amino-3-ketobutyrate coenzyme A ligase n=1 Tax=Kickxella alabastrina TaxID=61397 RepID=UPI0022204389|nr:2-amino-3-ketobutyrate coenzyme A ligase [Kickxella alabastrina]KAI7833185.1 2-amino-3-ketobutyrate coenzyme A ligase [Kickxella alabastrina]